MPIGRHEKYLGACDRDSEGYLIVYTGSHCVRCHNLVGHIKHDDKRRRFQILGYCEACQLHIMGW